MHGANTSDLLADPEKFPRAVERARQRHEYAHRLRGDLADGRALRRSRPLLELRVASYRLRPDDRPLPWESFRRLLWDALRSPVHPGPESAPKRAQVLLWSLLTLLAPDVVARRLVRMRYRRDRRPLRPAARGGRPVIYQANDEYELLLEDQRYRHVRFEPDSGVDYSWEREWRIRADELALEHAGTTFIVPTREWAEEMMDRWSGPIKRAAVLGIVWPSGPPSHFLVLEDLGIPFGEDYREVPSRRRPKT